MLATCSADNMSFCAACVPLVLVRFPDISQVKSSQGKTEVAVKLIRLIRLNLSERARVRACNRNAQKATPKDCGLQAAYSAVRYVKRCHCFSAEGHSLVRLCCLQRVSLEVLMFVGPLGTIALRPCNLNSEYAIRLNTCSERGRPIILRSGSGALWVRASWRSMLLCDVCINLHLLCKSACHARVH